MSQNIYDNEDFFAGYSRLARSQYGLDGAPEWASIEALLPVLNGLSVVDLGCGYGWFCRKAVEKGAAKVLGLDLSEMMLAKAKSMATRADEGRIIYSQCDLDALKLEEKYDFAYSSLTLHYLVDIGRFFKTIHDALTPGGYFVFSVEHPMLTAPAHPGWQPDREGKESWPVNDYLVEGRRVVNWIVDGVVKQHRSMGAYVNALVESGFSICHMEEWGPSDEQARAMPDLAAERDRPTLVIFKVRR